MTAKDAQEVNSSMRSLTGVAVGAVSFALTLGLIIWQMGDNASKSDKVITDSFNASLDQIKEDVKELKRHDDDGHPQIFQLSIESIKTKSALIAKWKEEHDAVFIALNAAQWERIFALEREVFNASEVHDSPGRAEGASN